jgi:hypothetical protein
MDNKYSFKQLLESEIIIDFEKNKRVIFSKIEIPMIQRDYAQGRTKVEGDSIKLIETGKRFIDNIFAALIDGKSMQMDFIYGSINEYRNNNLNEYTFIPLDGQQRLTTLFLLYWYIGSRELDPESTNKLMGSLKKFTYSTRTSSRSFCSLLCETKFSFEKKPSDEVGNLFCFFKSYKKDPTIKAMLNMLDAIHERYSTNTELKLYQNIENLKFYVLPLNEFKLTEDLYIKMNARGKQLSDFENFKADLIKWMKEPKNRDNDCPLSLDDSPENNVICKNCQENCFHKYVKLHNRDVNYYMSISQKLDNEWTNYFWSITKFYDVEKKDKQGNLIYPYGKLVDPLFIRFFHRYCLNLAITTIDDVSEKIEQSTLFKYFYGNQGNDSLVKFETFEVYENLLSFEVLENISRVLNVIYEKAVIIKENISPVWDNDKSWMFYEQDILQRQRIAFFATTLYIESNDIFFDEKYKDWMRFVWNIIIDPNLRSVPAMINGMKFIKSLSSYSHDIIRYLEKFQGKSDQYEIQFEEEVIKAKLIVNNIQFKDLIIEAESHKLFKGNIRFLLINNEFTSLEDFVIHKNAAQKLFKENDLTDKAGNYLWIRALLAKNSSEDFSDTKYNLSNGTFDNWRYLINGQFLKATRALIKEISSSNKSTNVILNEICANYQRIDKISWVYPLITWVGDNGETLLGNYSDSRLIQSYDNQMWLYNSGSKFTEGNIILSNCRNQIVKEILLNSKQTKFHWYIQSYHGSIQNTFFRGWNVKLFRKVQIVNNEFQFEYFFDRKHLRVGIREIEDLRNEFTNIQLKDSIETDYDEKAVGWLCRKKYDYQNDVIQEIDIINFQNKIEKEVFDISNQYSLVSKISASLNITK